mmetsp:Transcript_55782/g.109201  ORF Transcript_55782/g.109201 Transcript_55782/m.109201 type:complete len:184 (+) Transcript_55782:2047-2598(+)
MQIKGIHSFIHQVTKAPGSFCSPPSLFRYFETLSVHFREKGTCGIRRRADRAIHSPSCSGAVHPQSPVLSSLVLFRAFLSSTKDRKKANTDKVKARLMSDRMDGENIKRGLRHDAAFTPLTHPPTHPPSRERTLLLSSPMHPVASPTLSSPSSMCLLFFRPPLLALQEELKNAMQSNGIDPSS